MGVCVCISVCLCKYVSVCEYLCVSVYKCLCVCLKRLSCCSKDLEAPGSVTLTLNELPQARVGVRVGWKLPNFLRTQGLPSPH